MEERLENLVIPRHVALILDGNGRWAKKRGLPRTAGHKQGCVAVEQIVEDAARLGIGYLTVYGFSTENWKRSAEEVGALMQLFRFYTKRLLKIAGENNVRVKMIGDRYRFAQDIIDGINNLEEKTRDNTGLTFVIAVNYGSRDEIRRAVQKMLTDCRDGKEIIATALPLLVILSAFVMLPLTYISPASFTTRFPLITRVASSATVKTVEPETYIVLPAGTVSVPLERTYLLSEAST